MEKRSEIFKLLKKKYQNPYEEYVIKKAIKKDKEVKKEKLMLLCASLILLVLALSLQEWRRVAATVMLFLSSTAGFLI